MYVFAAFPMLCHTLRVCSDVSLRHLVTSYVASHVMHVCVCMNDERDSVASANGSRYIGGPTGT